MFDTHSSFMNGLLTFMVRFVVFLLALLMVAWGTWSLMGLAFADDDWVMRELEKGAGWEYPSSEPLDLDPPSDESGLTVVIDPEAGETVIWKMNEDITLIRKGPKAITCYDLGNGVIKCQ